MTRPRVVITGVGGVTPLANDIESTWKKLLAGESGIAPITLFDASAYDSRIAGEVKNFAPEEFMPVKQVRRMDRFTQFAVASAQMLLKDSGYLAELKADKKTENESRIENLKEFIGVARDFEHRPLLIKQFAGGASEELWFDLDLAPADASLETRLSILAGWILAAEAAHVRYGLDLPGQTIAPDQGDTHRNKCLEALALYG